MISSVVTPLEAFKGALNTDIKDEIYDQIGFLKQDIIGFADEIVLSFKTDFGKCKVEFFEFYMGSEFSYLNLILT